MTEEKIKEVLNTAETIQNKTDEVKNDINNILEPEVKRAQFAAYDTTQLIEALSRRVTLLFLLSIGINAATLLYVINAS